MPSPGQNNNYQIKIDHHFDEGELGIDIDIDIDIEPIDNKSIERNESLLTEQHVINPTWLFGQLIAAIELIATQAYNIDIMVFDMMDMEDTLRCFESWIFIMLHIRCFLGEHHRIVVWVCL